MDQTVRGKILSAEWIWSKGGGSSTTRGWSDWDPRYCNSDSNVTDTFRYQISERGIPQGNSRVPLRYPTRVLLFPPSRSSSLSFELRAAAAAVDPCSSPSMLLMCCPICAGLILILLHRVFFLFFSVFRLHTRVSVTIVFVSDKCTFTILVVTLPQ